MEFSGYNLHVFLQEFETVPLAVDDPKRTQAHVKFIETADESAAEFLNALAGACCRIDNEVAVTGLARIDKLNPAVRHVQ